MLNFKTEPGEHDAIVLIARRATEELNADFVETMMDITVANNDTKLDLEGLLAFPRFDFAHDVFGIRRHLNRKTGVIEGYFLPRSART
jgi:hypothetical protein